jgi:hypothetical protein
MSNNTFTSPCCGNAPSLPLHVVRLYRTVNSPSRPIELIVVLSILLLSLGQHLGCFDEGRGCFRMRLFALMYRQEEAGHMFCAIRNGGLQMWSHENSQ